MYPDFLPAIYSFQDLSSFVTKSIEEIRHVMSVGNSNRSVGSVFMGEGRSVGSVSLGKRDGGNPFLDCSG